MSRLACDRPQPEKSRFGRENPRKSDAQNRGPSRSPGASPGPVERLADEPAEHATGGNQMIAGDCQLCRVALAVFRIERRSGPSVFAVRLHIGKQLLADLGGAARFLL